MVLSATYLIQRIPDLSQFKNQQSNFFSDLSYEGCKFCSAVLNIVRRHKSFSPRRRIDE